MLRQQMPQYGQLNAEQQERRAGEEQQTRMQTRASLRQQMQRSAQVDAEQQQRQAQHRQHASTTAQQPPQQQSEEDDSDIEMQDVYMPLNDIHITNFEYEQGEEQDVMRVEQLDEAEYFPNLDFPEDEEEDQQESDDDDDLFEITAAQFGEGAQELLQGDQRSPTSNHSPLAFVRNPGNVLFYFFLGLYTGDGYHNQDNTLIGFRFRTTYFAYLYLLLTFIGVELPRFRFYNQVFMPSVRYGTGNIGGAY
ncbi:hypothetical protein MBANPS3_003568 [Mucor bainieri]